MKFVQATVVIAALVAGSAFAQTRFYYPGQQQTTAQQPLIFNPNSGEYRTDQGERVYSQPGMFSPRPR